MPAKAGIQNHLKTLDSRLILRWYMYVLGLCLGGALAELKRLLDSLFIPALELR